MRAISSGEGLFGTALCSWVVVPTSILGAKPSAIFDPLFVRFPKSHLRVNFVV